MTVGPLAMMTAAGEGEVEVEADPAGKHKAIFFNKSQKCVPIVTYSQQHIEAQQNWHATMPAILRPLLMSKPR